MGGGSTGDSDAGSSEQSSLAQQSQKELLELSRGTENLIYAAS